MVDDLEAVVDDSGVSGEDAGTSSEGDREQIVTRTSKMREFISSQTNYIPHWPGDSVQETSVLRSLSLVPRPSLPSVCQYHR